MAIKGIRAAYFPYCLEKLNDGSWVLLNRNYKPVGFNTSEYVEYEKYPVTFRLDRVKVETLRKLACEGDGGYQETRIWLYNDSCVPTSSAKAMKSYLQKLETLMALKTSD